MKAEEFNDKLEEIFGQRLNHSSVEDDLWNLPSERVWIGIEPHLPSRKKRRLIWWWWIMSATLLVGGIWFLLEGKKLWDKSDASENTEIPYALKQAIVPCDTAFSGQYPLSSNVVPENLQLLPPTKARVDYQDNFSLLDTFAATDKVLDLLPANATAELNKNETFVPLALESSTHWSSQTIAKLPYYNLVQDALKYPIAISHPVPVTDFSSKWYLEMSLGDFLRLNPTHLTGNLDLKLGNNHTAFAGVQVERQFSKNWSLGAGLTYSALQFDADYLFKLHYSAIGEQQTTIGAVQEYDYQLPSLATTLETRVVLVRDVQQNLQEGSDIPISMQLHHQVEYLSIPTYVKYQMDTAKRWRLYTKVGLLSNILVSELETAHTSTNSLHQNVHHHSSSVMQTTQIAPIAPNRLGLDAIFALGLKYHHHNNGYLFIEPTLKQELRPTYNNTAIPNSTALGIIIGIGTKL